MATTFAQPDSYYAERAKEAAGNHRKFRDFAWSDRPEDDGRWTLVYTSNRDSRLLDESNAAAIDEALQPYIARGTVVPECHSHWAVGYVDGYRILVYRKDGRVTAAFKTWIDLHDALADYPVLDEEDYSRREYEATLENIDEVLRRVNRDDEFVLPEEATGEIFSWLWDNDQREVESRDDQGGYPSEEAVRKACTELGWKIYWRVDYNDCGQVVEEYDDEWAAEERCQELAEQNIYATYNPVTPSG